MTGAVATGKGQPSGGGWSAAGMGQWWWGEGKSTCVLPAEHVHGACRGWERRGGCANLSGGWACLTISRWVTAIGGACVGFSVAERRCDYVGGRSLAVQTVVMYHRLILHEMWLACHVSVSTMGTWATDKPPSTLPSTSSMDKMRGLYPAVVASVFKRPLLTWKNSTASPM